MTDHDDLTVVRPRSAGEVAEALRFLIDPYPADSVVALAQHGDAGLVTGIMVFPIPTGQDDWQPAAYEAVQGFLGNLRVRGREAEQAVLAVLREPGPDGTGQAVHDDLEPLALSVAASFTLHGVRVSEVFSITAGHWRSYLCADPECCDPDGTPVRSVAEAGPVTTAMVYAGITPARTRADIEAELQPLTDPEACEEQVREIEAAQLAAALQTAHASEEAVRERTGEHVASAVRHFREGAAEPAPDEAAALITGLQDRLARDNAVIAIAPEDTEHAHRLWLTLVRRCVPPYDDHAPPLLTLLGWTAWLQGDTATARVAFTEAATIDSDYPLPLLLLDAINTGLRVEDVRARFARAAPRRP